MNDHTQENITERMENAYYYFLTLIVQSRTVQTNHYLDLKAKAILSEMMKLNTQIKRQISKQ